VAKAGENQDLSAGLKPCSTLSAKTIELGGKFTQIKVPAPKKSS
jgi:hypothetical protein